MKNGLLLRFEINWQEISDLWYKNPIPNTRQLIAVDSWFICTYIFSQMTNANIILTGLLNSLKFSAFDYIYHNDSQSGDTTAATSVSPENLGM